MPSRSPHPRLAIRLRRFGRSHEGATAVEFGMIAMPFFGLMFAIIETALAFWSNQVLETAVANASRQLYTGQFQDQNPAVVVNGTTMNADDLKAKFKALVCGHTLVMFSCAERVTIDVRSVGEYGGAKFDPPIKDGKYDTTGYGYQAPGSNVITVVRATMEYPVFTTFLPPASGLTNGNRLIMASSTFRTEPYTPGGSK